MVEHIYTYDSPPSERDLKKACDVLEKSGIIAYPTDVNWAFGCDASNVRAIDKIRLLKPYRPKDRPFSLICSDISMASKFANIEHTTFRFLKKAWPGPFTILLERSKNLARQINDKRRIVGIRIPDSKLVLALVEKLGRPLITTSVPTIISGYPPKFGHEIFNNFGYGLDLILDLGKEVSGMESTIIDFTQGYPVLVREGVGDPTIFDI